MTLEFGNNAGTHPEWNGVRKQSWDPLRIEIEFRKQSGKHLLCVGFPDPWDQATSYRSVHRKGWGGVSYGYDYAGPWVESRQNPTQRTPADDRRRQMTT